MAIRPHPWWLRLVDHCSRMSMAKFLPFVLSNGVRKRCLPRRPTHLFRNLGPGHPFSVHPRVLWLKPKVNGKWESQSPRRHLAAVCPHPACHGLINPIWTEAFSLDMGSLSSPIVIQ